MGYALAVFIAIYGLVTLSAALRRLRAMRRIDAHAEETVGSVQAESDRTILVLYEPMASARQLLVQFKTRQGDLATLTYHTTGPFEGRRLAPGQQVRIRYDPGDLSGYIQGEWDVQRRSVRQGALILLVASALAAFTFYLGQIAPLQ